MITYTSKKEILGNWLKCKLIQGIGYCMFHYFDPFTYISIKTYSSNLWFSSIIPGLFQNFIKKTVHPVLFKRKDILKVFLSEGQIRQFPHWVKIFTPLFFPLLNCPKMIQIFVLSIVQLFSISKENKLWTYDKDNIYSKIINVKMNFIKFMFVYD